MTIPSLHDDSLPAQRLAAGREFHFDLRPFIHSDTDFRITVVSPELPWLHVDERGQASGKSPHIKTLKQYWVTLHIENASGVLTVGFLLQVVALFTPSTISPEIPSPMLRPLNPNLPQTHDLIDYLFVFFNEFHQEEWSKLIQDEAKKQRKEISNPIKLKEFKDVMLDRNPNIEKHLRQQRKDLGVLMSAELTAHEMMNLFRQGSQPTGSIVPVVFNYLAAPNPHNFSHLSNVLDAAALKLIQLMEKNQATLEKKQGFRLH